MVDQNKVYNIQVKVTGDAALQKFQKNLDAMGKAATASAKSLRNMDKNIEGLNGSFKGLERGAKNIAGVFAAAFSVDSIRNVVSATAEIGSLSRTLGLTAEQFQAYRFAAEQAGIEQSAFSSNLTAFVKRVGEAQNGVGPLVSGLKNYDQALLDAVTNARDQNEAFNLIADAIQDAESATEAAAIANAAFSRSGVAMVEVLRDGSQGLAAAREEAERLGIIIGDDLVESAEKFDAKLNLLQQQLKAGFSANVLEGLVSGFFIAQKVFADIQFALNTLFANVAGSAEKIGKFIEFAFTSPLDAIKIGIAELVQNLADSLQTIDLISNNLGRFSFDIPGIDAAVDKLDGFAETLRESSAGTRQFAADLAAIDATNATIIDSARAELDATKARIDAERELFGQRAEAAKLPPLDLGAGAAEELSKVEQALQRYRESIVAVQFDLDLLGDKQKILEELFNSGAISIEVYQDQLDKLNGKIKDVADDTTSLGESIQVALGNTLADGFGRLVDNIIAAESSFSDFAKQFIKDITAMIAKLVILNALQTAFGIGGGTTTANARGGVFQNGVKTFASGGVVSSPTLFPMANGGVGKLGEAGAEAIVPLARDNTGDLGVKMQINIQNNAPNVRVDTAQNGNDLEIIINQISSDILRGGSKIARSIENAYGVSRARGSV